ncbi:phospholipase A and acyltransferase 3-like [Anneissia japonica]|uniref:phospholipase A and acyltransferase 3-like n=1 Tax=Anneissia japonica TaxID=1529436 RepID=UPI001425AD55|nr:phospholipase A and acyltransferase 3-like [Anneissia japonica]XP_033100471.1 phospholipase A and acyltransferase 3-like [Anneissia japonica]
MEELFSKLLMSCHDIRPGDLVKVKRWKPIPYWHWGVYIGNGEVIHLSGAEFNIKAKDTAYVHRVSWKEFLDGDDRWDYIPCPYDLDRAEVVRRAKRAEGRLFRNRPYDLISNNCEHFARWCHGKAESKQVQDVAKWAAIGGAVVLGAGILAAAVLPDDKEEKQKEKRQYYH